MSGPTPTQVFGADRPQPSITRDDQGYEVGRTIAHALSFLKKANGASVAVPTGYGNWSYFTITLKEARNELVWQTRHAKKPADEVRFYSRLRAPDDRGKSTLYLGSVYEIEDQP
jgi:hypothetical protein